MKQLLTTGVILTLIFSICPSLPGQSSDGEIARLYLVDVKDGMGPRFESALKSHTEWRRTNGDPWAWTIYTVVNGTNLGDFVIRSGNHTWAELDAYEDFLNKGTIHYYASVGPYINGVTSHITRMRADQVRWPEDPSTIKYIEIVNYLLKPGHAAAFRKAITKAHDAATQTDWSGRYAWEWMVNGGPVPLATLVLPFTSYADMDTDDDGVGAMLTKVYGEEEANALMEGFAGASASVETQLLRFRPDLSLMK